METAEVKSAHSKWAVANRKDRNVPKEKVDELRRDYAAVKIAEFVEREVMKAPPLTEEQIAIISRAMRGTTATG